MAMEPPTPDEAASRPSMNWVMVFWLISFLVVVIFGVVTYMLGWIFRRG